MGNRVTDLMPVLSKQQQLPTVLPDQSPSPQPVDSPPNSNGPTALPLQNKGGLHQNVFIAGLLSGCLHAARRRSPRPSTSWSNPLLNAYANQLDLTVDPKCPSCGEEPQIIEHCMQRCPNAVVLRHQLFGEPSPPLSVLTTSLGSVLSLARKTLL